MAECDLRIGVVGAGIMGSGHIEYLSQEVDGANVAAVAEPNESSRLAELNRWELDCPGFSSLAEMLDSVELDGVVIASPDRFHAESIRLCLSRKLPALCEKPLAQSLEDAEELFELENRLLRDSGRPLIHLGFMRRFDPSFVKAKNIIDSGELGEVLYVNASTRNVSSPDIKSEELLTNIAVHEIDTLRWLLEDEWKALSVISGRPTAMAPEGTQDPIVLTGSTERGVLVVADIFANNSYGYDVRAEITLEKGIVRVGIWGEVSVIKEFDHPAYPAFTLGDNWMKRFRQGYINELKEWIAVLNGEDSHSLATMRDGLRTLQVLNWVL